MCTCTPQFLSTGATGSRGRRQGQGCGKQVRELRVNSDSNLLLDGSEISRYSLCLQINMGIMCVSIAG